MLSKEKNEYITRVGTGTPMGNLMRQYWLPVMLSHEVPEPDCDPVRVMMLGEKLIGFRDTSGQVGLIADGCPHRGASLFFGRNEENGIRCVYHGWKFDRTGTCVDMPNEPADSMFKTKVRARTYPCVERIGVVWAYLGPRADPPPMPDLEVFDVPEDEVEVVAAMRDCNWLQGMEGDLDTCHVNFLHRGAIKAEDLTPGTEEFYMAAEKAPRYKYTETEYGAMYGAYRPAGPGELYWRVAQFLFPCFTHIPRNARQAVDTRLWVPMDDYHTMYYLLRRRPQNEPASNGRFVLSADTAIRKDNSTDWYGRFRLEASADNDYLIDRDKQRRMVSYTGMAGAWTEDHAITESMGPIMARESEHLGSSDVMLTRVRRRLIDAASALADDNTAPPGVDKPGVYRTRSASIILPADTDWLEGTAAMRTASPAGER
jgi:phthalate 4,5-dioxygenase